MFVFTCIIYPCLVICSFEYQSVVSSLVPTLIFMKHADHSLGVLHHLKALLEILGPDQLEMEQPQVVSSVESSGGDYFSFINVQIVSVNYVNSCRLLYLNGVVSDPDAMECVTHIADLATKAPHVRTYIAQCLSVVYIVLNIQCPTSRVALVAWLVERLPTMKIIMGSNLSYSFSWGTVFALPSPSSLLLILQHA